MSWRNAALSIVARQGAAGSVLRTALQAVVALVGLSLLRRWLANDKRGQFNRGQPSRALREGSRSREDQGTPSFKGGGGGPASAEEMGDAWHFGGKRKWQWLHDGAVPNGWIEFCSNGVLRTSLSKENGSWERQGDSEMIASFGRCHHTLMLMQSERQPHFVVTNRAMKDGRPTKNPKQPKTRGRLEA
mmetsp:Transcript_51590/g.122756  ORF Transcript_51590/g.122756 Transcript_51590/m.122756 type:complete len:188 (-) Transcript_51590:161-724(-)